MEDTPLDRTPLANPHGLLIGARFLARVPAFLRHPFTLEEARAIHAARLRERDSRWLDFVQHALFGSSSGVLFRLFDHAGVSFGDVRELVAQDGLEGALRRLFEVGVYITSDEFKQRTKTR